MESGSVADLRAGIDKGLSEIGRTQSALTLAKDRNQQTADILRVTTDGSAREETGAALACLAEVDARIDEAIAASLLATEQLQTWVATV